MENMEHYNLLKVVPDHAKSTIKGGNLSGYTNINPQWRIEAMTSVYGEYGTGWYLEQIDERTYPCPNGSVLLFLMVAVYVKTESGFSRAAIGWGGDFIIEKNKNGLVANDEAYKMCFTDAIGTALKLLGVGADVYSGGKGESKYDKDNYSERRAMGEAPQNYNPPAQTNEAVISESQQKRLFAIAGKGNSDLVKQAIEEFGYEGTGSIKRKDYNNIYLKIVQFLKQKQVDTQQAVNDNGSQS